MSVLADIVRSSEAPPVFVTGGPARTPFDGPGGPGWANPAFAVHHMRSWASSLALGWMPPLAPPEDERAKRAEEVWERVLGGLAESDEPFVAQMWGPLTLAGQVLGLHALLEYVARDAARVDHAVAEVMPGALARVGTALGQHAAVVLVAEPMATVLGPEDSRRLLLAPMRQLMAAVHAGGADGLLHASGRVKHALPVLGETGARGFSITGGPSLVEAFELLPSGTVVLGNLASMRLLEWDERRLAEEARAMARDARGRLWIATPGSAVPSATPVERLAAFVDAARSAC